MNGTENMSDRWNDRLSEYLDDELEAAERRALESHLDECRECRTTLEDLKRVTARARSLSDSPPPAELWPAISARLGASRFPGRVAGSTVRQGARGRRFSFTLPQLAAAAAALVVLSAGASWLAWRGNARGTQLTVGAPDLQVTGGATTAGLETARFDTEIAQLRRALDEGRDRLDPATVATLEQNLKIIERAIVQAKRALAADPANSYLREHLAETMQRKIDLLRRATQLASAQG